MANVPPLFIPLDGRVTSQNPLVSPLDGTELFYAAWPGNATQGNSYKVDLDTMAAFITAFPYINEQVITTGATSGTPYDVPNTATRILFNKSVSSPSFAVLPEASVMQYPIGILFKDLKGDSATNNITITFSNSETCDGLSTVVIDIAYGWVTINPLIGGGGWYMTS